MRSHTLILFFGLLACAFAHAYYECVDAAAQRSQVRPPPVPGAPDGESQLHKGVRTRPRLCPEGQLPYPIAMHAPKGRPEWLRNDSSHTSSRATTAGWNYFYNSAQQTASPFIGLWASAQQSQPKVLLPSSHSLFELAVEAKGPSGYHIVEVGWQVATQYGHGIPTLFVFHWVDGVATCYNGCGWVQTSSFLVPGMPLNVTSTPQQFGLHFDNDAWWAYYENEYIGYFPLSLWKGYSFTAGTLAQVFGEVASSEPTPLIEMGDGKFGFQPGATEISDMYLRYQSGTSSWMIPSYVVTNPSLYDVGQKKNHGFAFGGPGAI